MSFSHKQGPGSLNRKMPEIHEEDDHQQIRLISGLLAIMLVGNVHSTFANGDIDGTGRCTLVQVQLSDSLTGLEFLILTAGGVSKFLIQSGRSHGLECDTLIDNQKSARLPCHWNSDRFTSIKNTVLSADSSILATQSEQNLANMKCVDTGQATRSGLASCRYSEHFPCSVAFAVKHVIG